MIEYQGWVESYPPQNLREPRIGMERAKLRTNSDGMESSAMVGITAFQPLKGFVYVAESYVDSG